MGKIEETAPPPASRAVGAGRGLLYITAAKIWFMVGGSAIGFVLPYVLASKVKYGEWGSILAWVSPINNVMVTATIQAVAKFATEGPEYVEGVKRAALKLQLVLDDGTEVAFRDARRLGRVRLRHDPRREPPISLLGFDALHQLPSLGRLSALLGARAAPVSGSARSRRSRARIPAGSPCGAGSW